MPRKTSLQVVLNPDRDHGTKVFGRIISEKPIFIFWASIGEANKEYGGS